MKLCFIDVETTGLNPQRCGIWSLSAIIESRVGNAAEVRELDLRIIPADACLVEEEAMKMAGLSIADMRAREDFITEAAAYARLVSFLKQWVDPYNKQDKFFLVGYNISFDYSFLRSLFVRNRDRYINSFFWWPPFDVMTMAGVHLRNTRQHMANFKLATVYETILQKALEGAHESAADIRATRELYYAITGD